MKEIPRRQNLRRRGKEGDKAIEDKIQQQEIESPKARQQEPPKTKKIHHQTLKAMQRRKKAEEQKMKEQRQEGGKNLQSKSNIEENKQQKIENHPKNIETEKKKKMPGRQPRQNPKGSKRRQNPQKVNQENTLLKYFAPLNNSISVGTSNKQKLNENSDNNINKQQELFSGKQSLKVITEESPYAFKNEKSGMIQQSKLKEKPISKPVENTELTYYNQYYDNIFDVLVPLDEINEEYLIFDKRRQNEYQHLVDKVHGRTENDHETTRYNKDGMN